MHTRVLVTGGAGFIGSNFVRHTLQQTPDVQVLNVDALTYAGHRGSLADLEGDARYQFEQCDITDREGLSVVFERFKPDLVVHFAAESHVDRSILGPGAFVTTNVVGTFNLLECCRAAWPQAEGLFHHISTDEVYGSLGPEGAFTEQTSYDPSSPYSASKASSDHLVRAYARTYGLETRITNCSNNYGPYQFPEKLIPLMILNAVEGKPLPIYGDGRNVRDWLFVEDHVEAIWRVIERGKSGETYNVGGNAERANIEVVDTICRLVAERIGKPVDALLSLKTYVKDRPGHDFRYAIDATKVRDMCGWAPRVSFEEGMAQTVDWYLAQTDWIDSIRSGAYRDWITENYTRRANEVARTKAAAQPNDAARTKAAAQTKDGGKP